MTDEQTQVVRAVVPEEELQQEEILWIFARLMAPFPVGEVKQRAGGGGRYLSYITDRQAENRLDDVVGPEAWDFDLVPWGDDQLIGTLTIRLPGGRVVHKSDVGGKAEMQAQDDDAKSASSDCFKRCARRAGIARYLYGDSVPEFAIRMLQQAGWSIDGLEAAPKGRNASSPDPRRSQSRPAPVQSSGRGAPGDPDAPRTGRALFAWVMKQQDHYGEGLLKHVNDWAKRANFPGRMTDYDSDQVGMAYSEARRYLRSAVEDHQESPVG